VARPVGWSVSSVLMLPVEAGRALSCECWGAVDAASMSQIALWDVQMTSGLSDSPVYTWTVGVEKRIG
jgi:hypothetical protein